MSVCPTFVHVTIVTRAYNGTNVTSRCPCLSFCLVCRIKEKLEIWGRAQREAARRRKFYWGTVEELKFCSRDVFTSRGPNATALSYLCSKRNVKLG